MPIQKKMITLSDKNSSDKIVEISDWCQKFCPTKDFVRRKFCPTKFCPVRYTIYELLRGGCKRHALKKLISQELFKDNL